MARRRRGLKAGSGWPIFAATVISRASFEKSFERFQPFLACLQSRGDPVGVTDRAEIERRIERFTIERAHDRHS